MTSANPSSPDHRPEDRRPAADLEERLTAYFHIDVPAALEGSLDRWPMEARAPVPMPPAVSGRPSRLGHRLARTRTWLTTAAAALAVFVVLATVAGAMGLVEWGHFFRNGFGTERIADEDLGTDLNLTQTVDGFTVTIGRVYADPFSVAMAVRITPPGGLPTGNVDLRQATLYDEAGRFLGGPGVQGAGETAIRTFYNNPLPAGATSVRYRYEITDLRYAVRPVVKDDQVVPIDEIVPGVPCQREPPYPGQPVDQPTDDTLCYLIASRPLSFTFEVPLGPGISLSPGPQTASNGTVANVSQVSAGRIGASVEIEGVGPFANVSVETGGQQYPLTTFGYACPYDGSSRFTYFTNLPIPLDTGTWTVRISASPGQIPANAGDYLPGRGQCNLIAPVGEWTFSVDPTITVTGSPQGVSGRTISDRPSTTPA